MTQSTSRTDSTGSLPGDPREGGGAPLSGRAVLLPRLKERDRIASALERAGARVLRAAVTRTVPGEAATLEATARRIMAGEAAWLVLTSARTVEALAPYLLAEAGVGPVTGGHAPHPEPTAPSSPYRTAPPHTPTTPPMRVAVVGPATARAWTELTGSSPDLVARGSAAALLEEPELAGGPATGGHAPHQEPGTPDPHDSAASPHAPITPPRQHQPSATTPPMRVAVVGPATAKAWTKLTGSTPDLVARGSATALLAKPALAGSPATGDHAPYQEPDISSTHHGAPSPHTPARSPESKTAPRGLPGGGRDDSDGRAHTFGDAPDSPQALPEAARRVLLPASALADPALADGLRRAGWEVEQVAAYTTVTADAHDLPPDLERTWATGGVDAVVLTAPSTTRAVLELLGPPPQGTGLVAIGATTAAAARELGLPVAATAPSPTPEGVLQATIDAIRGATGSAPAPQEPP
nr:uroporphyrinogen-III synthase [Actinomyces oris]